MKLWIASDLHLEVRKDFRPDARRPADFDVLVLAGDVMDGDVAFGVETAATMAGGKPAIYVAGNHCHWGRSFEKVQEEGLAAARRVGIHFLQNSGVEIDGVSFFGATLWDPMRRDPRAARPNLSAIMSGLEADPIPHSAMPVNEPFFVQGPGVMDRRAKIRDMQRQFEKAEEAILSAGAAVVITHYPPPSSLIASSGAMVWIHGHEHRIRDEIVSGTRVLANAVGMPSENRNASNLCSMVIDVEARPAPFPT